MRCLLVLPMVHGPQSSLIHELPQLSRAQAHKARAEAAVKGSAPIIVRKEGGGGGARDLHLDNFNISNG